MGLRHSLEIARLVDFKEKGNSKTKILKVDIKSFDCYNCSVFLQFFCIKLAVNIINTEIN